MPGSGSPTGMTRTITNMRRIGIRKVLTRKVLSDRFVEAHGTAQSETSGRQVEVKAGLLCRRMVRVSVVHAVPREGFQRNSQSRKTELMIIGDNHSSVNLSEIDGSHTGWRRDSARRLSLRSTGLSIRRGLSPRSVAEADSRPWRGPVGGREEHNMMTMMLWVMTVGVLSCLGPGEPRRPVAVVLRQAGTRRPFWH